jgi:hypothetical protein
MVQSRWTQISLVTKMDSKTRARGETILVSDFVRFVLAEQNCPVSCIGDRKRAIREGDNAVFGSSCWLDISFVAWSNSHSVLQHFQETS